MNRFIEIYINLYIENELTTGFIHLKKEKETVYLAVIRWAIPTGSINSFGRGLRSLPSA